MAGDTLKPYDTFSDEERKLLELFMRKALTPTPAFYTDQEPHTCETRKVLRFIEKIPTIVKAGGLPNGAHELAQIVGMPEETYTQIVQSNS